MVFLRVVLRKRDSKIDETSTDKVERLALGEQEQKSAHDRVASRELLLHELCVSYGVAVLRKAFDVAREKLLEQRDVRVHLLVRLGGVSPREGGLPEPLLEPLGLMIRRRVGPRKEKRERNELNVRKEVAVRVELRRQEVDRFLHAANELLELLMNELWIKIEDRFRRLSTV